MLIRLNVDYFETMDLSFMDSTHILNDASLKPTLTSLKMLTFRIVVGEIYVS